MKLPPLDRIPMGAPRAWRTHAAGVAATIDATLSRAFHDAGLDTAGAVPAHIRATIDDALAAAGLRGAAPNHAAAATSAGATYEGVATTLRRDDVERLAPRPPVVETPPHGRTTGGTFTNAAGTRGYRLYVSAPLPQPAPPRALVVMLHGCTQSPDDFAAGTGMNAIADREGLVVLYPAQDANANGSRCWNWFRPQDQERERGEPAILAGMALEIARAQGIDTGNIFVAGLSAGAGMAVILGAAYPEVFAAVGAHSGLAHRTAHDMPSAFAVMHGRRTPGARRVDTPTVPTIVFHGTADTTVTPVNGAAIVAPLRTSASTTEHHDGRSSAGVPYHRTVYRGPTGHATAEHWVIDGLGHAWSGGSAAGSYTYPAGPDASAEMLRFFRLHGTRGDA